MVRIIVDLFSGFYDFLSALVNSRKLILKLTKQDFKANYLGSYLTFVWAFIQPCITILIFFVVFQIAFKSGSVENHPFILWLMTGMIPWFFFSESLSNATNSIISYSFLVKKVVFRVSILPIIKILSALFVHLFFIIVIVIMFLLYGYFPTIYNLQVFYYLCATIVLVCGLSWITSSLTVFIKDISQIVTMLIQIGFWSTPIFWNFRTMPEEYQSLINLNPVFYIVEGYRESFISHTWFWEDHGRTIYFWCFTLSIFVIGAILFLKLRPHFADVI
jgi:lipopolysaccharide transport system permease protein/teichoic acid transport system permease protein